MRSYTTSSQRFRSYLSESNLRRSWSLRRLSYCQRHVKEEAQPRTVRNWWTGLVILTHHRVARKDVIDERSYPARERKVLRRDRVDRQAGLESACTTLWAQPVSTDQLVDHSNHALKVVVRGDLELADRLALHCLSAFPRLSTYGP